MYRFTPNRLHTNIQSQHIRRDVSYVYTYMNMYIHTKTQSQDTITYKEGCGMPDGIHQQDGH